jgi:hypothetical protein
MVESGGAGRRLALLGAAHCGPGHGQFAGQPRHPAFGELAEFLGESMRSCLTKALVTIPALALEVSRAGRVPPEA